eukprot:TRINITY_DN42824_c0_g1_i1.p1 TRINITY_DN42824_c0_g1~~TRINITY_DN42824_c0_g1_i1.p1  ORF type:complete len:591 (+),score=73.32 TRINITY_DN42824_c0_g1_i1:169-1941(+)
MACDRRQHATQFALFLAWYRLSAALDYEPCDAVSSHQKALACGRGAHGRRGRVRNGLHEQEALDDDGYCDIGRKMRWSRSGDQLLQHSVSLNAAAPPASSSTPASAAGPVVLASAATGNTAVPSSRLRSMLLAAAAVPSQTESNSSTRLMSGSTVEEGMASVDEMAASLLVRPPPPPDSSKSRAFTEGAVALIASPTLQQAPETQMARLRAIAKGVGSASGQGASSNGRNLGTIADEPRPIAPDAVTLVDITTIVDSKVGLDELARHKDASSRLLMKSQMGVMTYLWMAVIIILILLTVVAAVAAYSGDHPDHIDVEPKEVKPKEVKRSVSSDVSSDCEGERWVGGLNMKGTFREQTPECVSETPPVTERTTPPHSVIASGVRPLCEGFVVPEGYDCHVFACVPDIRGQSVADYVPVEVKDADGRSIIRCELYKLKNIHGRHIVARIWPESPGAHGSHDDGKRPPPLALCSALTDADGNRFMEICAGDKLYASFKKNPEGDGYVLIDESHIHISRTKLITKAHLVFVGTWTFESTKARVLTDAGECIAESEPHLPFWNLETPHFRMKILAGADVSTIVCGVLCATCLDRA